MRTLFFCAHFSCGSPPPPRVKSQHLYACRKSCCATLCLDKGLFAQGGGGAGVCLVAVRREGRLQAAEQLVSVATEMRQGRSLPLSPKKTFAGRP